MKKAIIPAILITACLASPLSQTASAQSIESNTGSNDVQSSQTVAGEEKVVQAFLDTTDGLKEITLSEYNSLISNAVTNAPIASPTGPRIPEKGSISPANDTGFSIVTSRKFLNVTNQVEKPHTYLKADMSDWLKNTSQKTVLSQTITWSNSYSWAATASIGGNWTSALAPVLGTNWQNTKTYTYSNTFTVQPGYKAKLQFTPIYKEATGDLVAYNRLGSILDRVNNVTVRTPASLDGNKTKGIVTVVEIKL